MMLILKSQLKNKTKNSWRVSEATRSWSAQLVREADQGTAGLGGLQG